MKNKILFRCDAGKVKKIGTGHLYRCIFLSKILKKKFNLKKNQIKFIIKSKNEYKIGPKILKEHKLNFIRYEDKYLIENSKSEIDILKKNSANTLIIDRLGKTNRKTILKLKKNFNKIIAFDDKSSHDLFDLKLNSLIYKNSLKKNKFFFKNLILPSYKKKLLSKNVPSKKVINIFINLGGWDKNNYTRLVINLLKKINLNLKIFVFANVKYKKEINFNNMKIVYFPKKNFYEKLKNSDLSIVSGGLVMFDSIFFKIPTICLPQDKDQYANAKRVNHFNANLIINPKYIKKSFIYNFNFLYKNYNLRKTLIKNGEKIVNVKNMRNVLKKIFIKCK